MLLVLEGMRRANGWVMPIITLMFLAYAMAGPWLPAPWTHKGYELGRIVGHMYMTLEGIFGAAIDVSSTLIILFTIFGAVLQYSNAGKFFIDFSFSAMGGKPTGAGRTVVLASFLLGGPSGSGVATTVTLGLGGLSDAGAGRLREERRRRPARCRRPGRDHLAAGDGRRRLPDRRIPEDLLSRRAADGGDPDAAVLPCAVPDGRDRRAQVRHGAASSSKRSPGVWELAREYWFHFASLVSIIAFMLLGFSPVLSVFWATMLAILTSFLHRDCALLPRNLFSSPRGFWSELGDSGLTKAMAGGSIGMLNVGTTCAGAGMIVGVVTLTGLGLKFSSIILAYAGGSLLLTAIYTALIVWIVGLAVPVTASYIICAVIAAPAMIKLGVPDFAAHMFIFYYAVLSEVSPPTALSPFAAAAITGGDPYRTTLQSWKYTMPAFLLPFMFVLDPGRPRVCC